MANFKKVIQSILIFAYIRKSILLTTTYLSQTTVAAENTSLNASTSINESDFFNINSTSATSAGTSRSTAVFTIAESSDVANSSNITNSPLQTTGKSQRNSNSSTTDADTTILVTTTYNTDGGISYPNSGANNTPFTTANVSLTTYVNITSLSSSSPLSGNNLSLTTTDGGSSSTHVFSSANTSFTSTSLNTSSTTASPLSSTVNLPTDVNPINTTAQTVVRTTILSVTYNDGSYAAGHIEDDHDHVNKTGVVLGAIIGSILGVALIILIGYILCGYRKNEQFSHRRLYENFPNDPVLRLDSPSHTLDFGYGGSAEYNPTEGTDYEKSKSGNPSVSIAMSDIKGPSGQPA